LGHGTDYFTSPPKEGMLRNFSHRKKSNGFGRDRTRELGNHPLRLSCVWFQFSIELCIIPKSDFCASLMGLKQSHTKFNTRPKMWLWMKFSVLTRYQILNYNVLSHFRRSFCIYRTVGLPDEVWREILNFECRSSFLTVISKVWG
jgi:hypothetical protein